MRVRTITFALVGAAITSLLLAAPRAGAEERYTVCSITINSADEISTFRKYLPEKSFQFVELTEGSSAGEPGAGFGRACDRGVQCDVVVISGHFGDTYAGNFGTTFAGDSGLTLSLDEMEQRSCEQSCPGILRKPLEVFLFGCKTLARSLDDRPLPKADLALLAHYGVPKGIAERVVEEERFKGSDTSNRRRMRFVFAEVPELYGFSAVGPTGEHARPLLEDYFKRKGNYAQHLRRLAQARSKANANRELAQAMQSSTFDQCAGLQSSDPEYERAKRICVLTNEKSTVLTRLAHIEKLLDDPGFLGYLPSIERFFHEHSPSSYGPSELATLRHIQQHARAREVAVGLVNGLETPLLRLEVVRVARTVGWVGADEALKIQHDVVVRALRPPVFGEGQDIVCGIEPEVLRQISIRAEELSPDVYTDEFGIQALGCLKPSDERIHLELSRSLFDSREWIARYAAMALKEIKPAQVDVQMALAQQLARPEAGLRESAGEALREVKAADPRVLATIRKSDPSFKIDWL